MKKLFALTLALLCLLGGCQKNTNAASATNNGGTAAIDSLSGQSHGELAQRMDGDVIEINEKIFIAQTNDIYYNAMDYMDKTIRYEGIYQQYVWEDEDSGDAETFHYVIRYGPGCCGNDGNAGFEVAWDGEWPQDNDWVEAVGRLEIYDYNGLSFLQLRLDSLIVLDERGAEYVSQ